MSEQPPLNPYSPPLLEGVSSLEEAPVASECFRHEDLLFVQTETALPDYCPFTGKAADESWKMQWHQLRWTPIWARYVYLTIPLAFGLNLLPQGPFTSNNVVYYTMIVAFVTVQAFQKQGRIRYGIHPPLHRAMTRWRIAALAPVILALVVIALFACFHTYPVASLWISLFLVALPAYPLTRVRRLRVKGVHNDWFRIKGCCPAFLDRLPQGTLPEA